MKDNLEIIIKEIENASPMLADFIREADSDKEKCQLPTLNKMQKQSKKVYSPEFYALRELAAKSMIPREEEIKIKKRSRYIVRCLTPHCNTIKESDDGLDFPLYCATCRKKEQDALNKLQNLKLNPVDEARKMRVKYLNDKNNNAERLKEVRIRYQQTDKYKTYQKEYQKNLTKEKNAKNKDSD